MDKVRTYGVTKEVLGRVSDAIYLSLIERIGSVEPNKEGEFTVEMMKKVQGFPEGYAFTGSKSDQYRQIGNAVSPPVAKAIAESIKPHLTP